ncbi:MAG: GPW/gp25 family protein [Pelagibacteraceae bacterium]|nr:GPW/gp25 family protein [Pelagibacteraceae bacterium]
MPSSREKDQDPDIFIGIGFPLGFSSVGIFNKTKTTLEQALHNLKNLLLTQPGERVGHPDFGCDIRGLLFEQISPDIETIIEERIKDSVDMWLSYLSINVIDINQLNNRLNVTVHFSLKNDMTSEKTVSLTYQIAE